MDTQTPGSDRATLRRALDELAARGTRMLRSKASLEGHHRGLGRGAGLLLVGPACILLVQLVQGLVGARVWDPSAAQLIIAVLLPWLGGALVGGWRATQRRIPRAQAIALFDAEADAEERLVAADELLASGARGPFVEAALADARWFVSPARASDLEALTPELERSRRERQRMLGCAAGALVLACLATLLGEDAAAPAVRETRRPPGVTVAAATPSPRQEPRPKPDAPEPAKTAAPDSTLQSEAGAAEAAARPADLPDEAKRKEGVGGAGRSSRAESSRGESDARGAPTNQGQESKKPVTKKPLKPETKKRKKKAFTKPPKAKQAAGEESGSTTGRGSSRGSNRNPVTSDWASKDQVTTEEDEEIEDDEDVEDETSDSQARGGVQPNLRDRKPPVSRDLGIGFGNQPNPNANGRGGPSQPKKSRGTASLVLGVPIPDRVKGQPNPGKTKVTQERVEPRRETSGGAQAQPRTPRSGPSTVLARPEISGWLRELVKTYFLELRKKESKTR